MAVFNGDNGFHTNDIPEIDIKTEAEVFEEDYYSGININDENLTGMADTMHPVDGAVEEDDLMKNKKRKKVQYNYTNSMLQEALDLVQSQNISIMNAAKQYGIPRSSLRRYALTVWAASAPKSKNKPETALTSPEEAHLVSMITKMSKAGKYVSTMDVKSTVQHLLDESQRVVFKDRNRPNAGWVQRFRKRHKDLEIKGSGYTPRKQTPLSLQDILDWQNEFRRYLEKDWEVNPNEFFCEENAHRIFNLDEMVLALNNKQDLLEENVPPIPKGDEEASEVTILGGVSAAGEFLQPLIIQKGEGGGHEDDIMPLDQNSYGISFSLSGKMNSEIFLRWLEAFDRELSEKEVQKPIVIFLDDIFAHFHISVFTYSIDNDIILLCVPNQNGAVLQPVEREINEAVKVAYRDLCGDHYKMDLQPMSLDQFPVTFLSAWEAVKDAPGMKQTIKESFHHFGLLPLNPEASGIKSVLSNNEALFREAIKSDIRQKLLKEPKAKKTVKLKQQHSAHPSLILPTVQIKKLENDSLDIINKDLEGPSTSYEPEDDIPFIDPLSLAEPILAKCDDWSPPSKIRKSNLATSRLSNGQSHLSLSQERLIGRQDGVKKCLDLMETFIPKDVIPVWRSRKEDLKNSAEIPFCMWKAVNKIFFEMTDEIDRKMKSPSNSNCPFKINRPRGMDGRYIPWNKATSEEFLQQMELFNNSN